MASGTLNPLAHLFRADYVAPESFWRSLTYFHLFRIFVASLFVLATVVSVGLLPFGGENTALARPVSLIYWAVAAGIPLAILYRKPSFNLLLSVEVFIDIVALTLLMAASGGSRSGVSYLLLAVLAAAGMLGQGRLTLFYAALATIGVFLEQAHRILHGNGEIADFSFVGFISIGFFAVATTASLLARRVVTNEALAQRRGEALASQMEVNQRVIRDMQDGVLVVDTDGNVLQYNPSAQRLWECVPSAQPTLDEFSPQLAQQLPVWRQSMAEAVAVMRSIRSQKLLRVRYVPAAGSSSALIYIEDMERIQAEAQAEARQIKLVALGRLTANMAHEIRNPLAAISHAAELLAENEGVVEGQQRLARIINDNSLRLNRLVTDVMELGRRDRAQPQSVKLKELLSDVLEDLVLSNPSLRSMVTIQVGDDCRITFDRSHLYRVITNLIENARNYCSGNEGCIRVVADRSSVDGCVVIEIADDGPGVPADLRNTLFEPFFTTRQGGTGLGLYIARELCEANGASLELIAAGRGACFQIAGRKEQ